MFAHPEGIRSVKKEDFVKLLPQRKEFFKSLGLQSSTIVSIQTFELDAQYVLAKVVWKFRLERKSRELIDSENSSTYIMMAVDDSFQIVFQLDHDNLAKKLEEFSN